jgi:hypothetical protein
MPADWRPALGAERRARVFGFERARDWGFFLVVVRERLDMAAKRLSTPAPRTLPDWGGRGTCA